MGAWCGDGRLAGGGVGRGGGDGGRGDAVGGADGHGDVPVDRHRGVDELVGAGTGDDGGGGGPPLRRDRRGGRRAWWGASGRAGRGRQRGGRLLPGVGCRRRGGGCATGLGTRGAWRVGAHGGAHWRSAAARRTQLRRSCGDPLRPAERLRPMGARCCCRTSPPAWWPIISPPTPRSTISVCTACATLAVPNGCGSWSIPISPTASPRCGRWMSSATTSRALRPRWSGGWRRWSSCVASRLEQRLVTVTGAGGWADPPRPAGRRRVGRPVPRRRVVGRPRRRCRRRPGRRRRGGGRWTGGGPRPAPVRRPDDGGCASRRRCS